MEQQDFQPFCDCDKRAPDSTLVSRRETIFSGRQGKKGVWETRFLVFGRREKVTPLAGRQDFGETSAATYFRRRDLRCLTRAWVTAIQRLVMRLMVVEDVYFKISFNWTIEMPYPRISTQDRG
ncbi:hypothetical protein RvY_08326 [Ramazzottius varieornatus]|uniref:Uncharacterized protein n=1 Tax=Ramazzottius varieornatus TaxID=947166 RepID=A0A1D1VA46_RAMVA|nr:hypothetical protein RvY_08326 [Ramazzottius varieornatus]